MKDHEISFKNAKKDRNGYATIIVVIDEYYIPVKGKPLPLIKEEAPDLKEINRLNLTRWNIKDIPEIARRVGNLCGGAKGLTAMLYWNGSETAWKFWNEGPSNVVKDDDDTVDWLDYKIEDLEDEGAFYKPHNDNEGNMGDESVHCVYDGKSGIPLWNDSFKHGGFSMSEIKSEDCQLAADLICHSLKNFYDVAIEAVNKARSSHKRIPYDEIGEAIRKRINGMSNKDIAKFFLLEI